jgi:hypothetical protein
MCQQRKRILSHQAKDSNSISGIFATMNLGITSKNLYFIILRALLGFNIFHSLFGRSSTGDIECGSWFFPTLKGGSTGFMALGNLACGQSTQGKFIEALASSFFLAFVWIFETRSIPEKRPRKPKKVKDYHWQ